MSNKDIKKSRSEQYRENRKALIELSKYARQLVKEVAYDSVNEAIIDVYKEQHPNAEEFNTFHQWKSKGYTIIKGSKAFYVWGQPREAQQTPTDSNEPEEFKYWPICYLFSNEQVIKPEMQPEPVQEVTEDLPI